MNVIIVNMETLFERLKPEIKEPLVVKDIEKYPKTIGNLLKTLKN